MNALTSSASILLNVTCIMLSCNVFTSISLTILSTSTEAENPHKRDNGLNNFLKYKIVPVIWNKQLTKIQGLEDTSTILIYFLIKKYFVYYNFASILILVYKRRRTVTLFFSSSSNFVSRFIWFSCIYPLKDDKKMSMCMTHSKIMGTEDLYQSYL